MNKIHNIQSVEFVKDKMVLKVDNHEYVFNIEKISKKLLNASETTRERYEVSPSGYGLHWPLIDEDLSIDGLLGIKHVPSQKRELVS